MGMSTKDGVMAEITWVRVEMIRLMVEMIRFRGQSIYSHLLNFFFIMKSVYSNFLL